jgi:type III restriction enzyme
LSATYGSFYHAPIPKSPYEHLARHWKLDENGVPTDEVVHNCRRAESITTTPAPQRRAQSRQDPTQATFDRDEYDPTSVINEIRGYVDRWRSPKDERDWMVTPETARLLRHWRHHQFTDKRPFFCQIEVEAWESLHSAKSRPFSITKGGRIAVKVINHLGDEVMKGFRIES